MKLFIIVIDGAVWGAFRSEQEAVYHSFCNGWAVRICHNAENCSIVGRLSDRSDFAGMIGTIQEVFIHEN